MASDNRNHATVMVAELKTKIFIDNVYAQNYALDRDTVVIEV